MATRTPWTEAVELRRQLKTEHNALGPDTALRGLHQWRADETTLWVTAMQTRVAAYEQSCAGRGGIVDPREALIELLAVVGAAIDALGDV